VRSDLRRKLECALVHAPLCNGTCSALFTHPTSPLPHPPRASRTLVLVLLLLLVLLALFGALVLPRTAKTLPQLQVLLHFESIPA
jgi:hypothetical protein